MGFRKARELLVMSRSVQREFFFADPKTRRYASKLRPRPSLSTSRRMRWVRASKLVSEFDPFERLVLLLTIVMSLHIGPLQSSVAP